MGSKCDRCKGTGKVKASEGEPGATMGQFVDQELLEDLTEEISINPGDLAMMAAYEATSYTWVKPCPKCGGRGHT
jgi:hypothetical protein